MTIRNTIKYSALLVDPPWHFATYSARGRGRCADRHYTCLPLDAIKAMPVADMVTDDSVLFLWTTDTHLLQALEVIEAWGFVYKTVGFYWAKTTKDGKRFPIGLGHWTRANPEMCLLATRGHPHRLAKNVRKLIVSPRREHSRKPDDIYESIERLVPGPYLELFSRTTADGWECMGDECGRWMLERGEAT